MGFYLSRALIVVVATSLVFGIAFYMTRDAVPTYDATAKILVEQPLAMGAPTGVSNVAKIQQLIPTYAQIVTSSSVAEKVAETLPNVSAIEVADALFASPVEKTQILVIDAHSKDERKARDIAGGAARVFIERMQNQQDEANLKPEEKLTFTIVEPPTYVKENIPQSRRTVLLSTVAALIVFTGAAVVFESARRA